MPITLGSNISSMRAQRQLSHATRDLSQTYTRLSSGQRINKASDDAAGLAISDSLTADSRISKQALRNVNDGISMISIVSGALDSQKKILFRMAELAEQSANGVYSDEQRSALQDEYMALQEEFDRIADSTEFNGIKLLRNKNNEEIQLMAGITGAEESLLTMTGANSHRFAGVYAEQIDTDNYSGMGFQFVDSDDTVKIRDAVISGIGYEGTQVGEVIDVAKIGITDSEGNKAFVRIAITPFSQQSGSYYSSPSQFGIGYTTGGATATHTSSDVRLYAEREDGDVAHQIFTFNHSDKVISTSFNFSTSGTSASIEVDISDLQIELADWDVDGADKDIRSSAIGFTIIESQKSAVKALDIVNNRIDDLSKLQGEYGSIESRLKITSSQLLVNQENFLSAATQIRDADIASEAANLTRTGILQQTATSVLAQANQQSALVLQLL